MRGERELAKRGCHCHRCCTSHPMRVVIRLIQKNRHSSPTAGKSPCWLRGWVMLVMRFHVLRSKFWRLVTFCMSKKTVSGLSRTVHVRSTRRSRRIYAGARTALTRVRSKMPRPCSRDRVSSKGVYGRPDKYLKLPDTVHFCWRRRPARRLTTRGESNDPDRRTPSSPACRVRDHARLACAFQVVECRIAKSSTPSVRPRPALTSGMRLCVGSNVSPKFANDSVGNCAETG